MRCRVLVYVVRVGPPGLGAYLLAMAMRLGWTLMSLYMLGLLSMSVYLVTYLLILLGRMLLGTLIALA